MPEASLVPQFLKAIAAEHGFAVYDCIYGTIDVEAAYPIEQSAGAVYGIWANLPVAPRPGLLPIPEYRDWYPVYWGKDISPVSRLKAHVKGHKNGNIKLKTIREISGAPLVYGALLVSEYSRFERLLHERFPPLKGTHAIGRASTVVRVR
jgi:hypothetical protein